MARFKCSGGDHCYEKFNEALLFCKRCGDIRTVRTSGRSYWYPYQPQPRPWWPGVPMWTTGGITSTVSNIRDTWNNTVTSLTEGATVQKDVKSPVQPPAPKGTKTIKGTADPEKKT